MKQKPATCDPGLIQRLLRDELEAAEQTAVEEHLERCPQCRRALESSAADAGTWLEARDFLSDDLDETSAADGHGREAESVELEAVLAGLAPSDDPRMLGRLGGYEISGVIGRGGMGVVLKGFDVPLNRYVAIKLLAPHLASSGAARQRFAREAKAAAAIVHENVVAIHGVEAGRLPYFVMSYVRGASLQKRLDRDGPLDVPEVLRIARQVAAGLAAAHAQGLVHRDIKPANILLEDGVERLKLTDFGLARAADDASLTRTGVIAGTPQYMSPEQARGEAVDERSDLFSLGSVIYAMCAGRPPFRAETSYGVLRRICEDEPRPLREVNPQVPEPLAAIVEKLHRKRPEERYRSAEQVEELLERYLAHLQQPATIPLPKELCSAAAATRRRGSAGASPSRRVIAIAVGTVGLLVVIVATALWPFFRGPASDGTKATGAAAGLEPASSSGEGQSARDAAAASASDDWDGGVSQATLELEADAISLERRAARLWDDEPPAAASDEDTNQPSTRENPE